jgi:hypothetical protein
MSYNMMIGHDIYDRFTIEHFPLRQSMILTTSFFLLATAPMFLGKKKSMTALLQFPNMEKYANLV